MNVQEQDANMICKVMKHDHETIRNYIKNRIISHIIERGKANMKYDHRIVLTIMCYDNHDL